MKEDMKMKRWLTIPVITFCLTLCWLCPAIAHELHLANGDVINGRIIRMEEDKLIFKTSYADEISVNWTEVTNLIADDPIKVVLSDGTVLEGVSRKAPANTMRIKTDKLEAPADFKLSEVAAINPVKKPVVKITLRTNAGLTQERGNTDTDSLRIDGDFIARTVKSRYSLGGELNTEKADGDKTVENWLVYGKYDYFFLPKWFAYASTLFEHDEFADLDLRSTLSAGVGHQFFESDLLNLSAAVGPAYVSEDFIEDDDDDYSAGQWSINYDQFFFDKIVQLFHRQTGTMRLSDTGQWLIKTRQGLRFPIYKGFTTTLQYNYDYNNRPSAAAEDKWDSKLMFLLGWHFQN
jgi:putative salt-induced outer membrane protein YdiY